MSFFDRFRSSPRLLVTLGILGGSFLAAMEATIVATAMPTVVDQFGGLAHYSWVFSGYMLTSTVTTPVWGRIADVHGRRRPYLVALGLFLLGSMLCGVATSMTQLIAFRALQGVGAGGMLPLGMVIMGDMFSLEERAKRAGAVCRRVGHLVDRRAAHRRGADRERVVALDFLHEPAVRPGRGVPGGALPRRQARRRSRRRRLRRRRGADERR